MLRAFPLLLLAMTACVRGPTRPGPTGPKGAPTTVVDTESSPDALVCRPAKFPDTTAGRRLEELVAAVNEPDASATEDFVAEAMTAFSRQRHAQLIWGMRAGSTIATCRVHSTAANEVVAILGDTDANGVSDFGWFVLSVDHSGKVASFGFMPATREDIARPIESLDDDDVRQVAEAVAEGLADYVFADKAAEMATRIRKAREGGEYAGINNGHALAQRLNDDILAVTSDKHLSVIYSASVLERPGPETGPTPEQVERIEQQAANDEFGVPVAEVRDGNVGYLDVRGLLPPELSGEAVAAAMTKLADADVLIMDLRHFEGGYTAGVAYMASYLFGDEPVHRGLHGLRLLHRVV